MYNQLSPPINIKKSRHLKKCSHNSINLKADRPIPSINNNSSI